jgi:hypothetical protein
MRVALLGGIMRWPGEAVEGFVSWLSVMRIGNWVDFLKRPSPMMIGRLHNPRIPRLHQMPCTCQPTLHSNITQRTRQTLLHSATVTLLSITEGNLLVPITKTRVTVSHTSSFSDKQTLRTSLRLISWLPSNATTIHLQHLQAFLPSQSP